MRERSELWKKQKMGFAILGVSKRKKFRFREFRLRKGGSGIKTENWVPQRVQF